MNNQNCCGDQSDCRNTLIPAAKKSHASLHDKYSFYRQWHHNPLRVHVHVAAVILALIGGFITILASDHPISKRFAFLPNIEKASAASTMLVNITSTTAGSAPGTYANVPALSTSASVSASDSILLMIANIPCIHDGTDRSADFRFAVDGAREGPEMTLCYSDNTNEGAGGMMMWARTGLSGSHTFSVQWQNRTSTPSLDTARTRSFQVIEIPASEASLLTNITSTTTDSAPGTYANIAAFSSTVSVSSANSTVLMLGNVMIATGGSDETADFRFAVDGAREGPEMTLCYNDNNAEVICGGMAWAKTGISGSHTFSMQWQDRTGTPSLDTGRTRSFQVLELKSSNLLTNVTSTTAGSAPGTYADIPNFSSTVSVSASSSVLLMLGHSMVDTPFFSDETADYRFATGGVREGPEITKCYADNINEGACSGIAWAKTGVSGSQTFSLQWQDRTGTPSLDTTRTRSFQVIELFDPPTINQSAYRFYNNTDSTDVGTPLAAQDTATSLGSNGDAFRLRQLLHVANNQLATSGQSFKLQFANRSGTCDTGFSGETYADVTGATAIAYNNNATPADGAALTGNANDPVHSGHTNVNQTYEELNNFTNSVAAIPAGQDGKWDFALIDNDGASGNTYCLRVVKSDGSLLNSYTVIPEITTIPPNVRPTGSFNSAVQKTDGSGNADISIEVNDGDANDTRAKIEYESDSDGACDGPWTAATLLGPATADFDDSGGAPDVNNANPYQVGSGTNTRIITSSGSNTVDFDWDSDADLPSADGTQCLRLTVNDDFADQLTPDTQTLSVDNVDPSFTTVSVSPSSGIAKISDTVTVTMNAGETGLGVGTCTINSVDVSGSFTDNLNNTYDISYTLTEGNSDWTAGNLPLSCTLTDSAGNTGTAAAFTDGNTLAGDANSPTGLTALTAGPTTQTTQVLNWSAVTESNFDHYEIWFGTIQGDVDTRSGAAIEWDDANDIALATRTTTTTTITALVAGVEYYYKIFAVDTAGNEETVPSIAIETSPLPHSEKFLCPDITFASVAINSGAESTAQRDVVLTLNQSDATLFKVSEDANFLGAKLHAIASQYKYKLSPNGGKKTVYVQFLNNCKTDIVSDSIQYIPPAPPPPPPEPEIPEEPIEPEEPPVETEPEPEPSMPEFSAGELLKGSASTIYYYGIDKKLHAFPNPDTYFTWYDDFSQVRNISDAELNAIPLGKNVTYRPGTRLVKFPQEPRVYAISLKAALQWIRSPFIALALYGSEWTSLVDDINDEFADDYQAGDDIFTQADHSPSLQRDLAVDIDTVLGLKPPPDINGRQQLPAESPCQSETRFISYLTLGSVSPEVRELQSLLQCLGYFPIDTAPTAIFATQTLQAVQAFQAANNVPALGTVGPGTRVLLNQHFAGEEIEESECSTSAPFTIYMSTGLASEEVRRLQELLRCLGYFPAGVEPTGYYGPVTIDSVAAFQQAKGINPLGVVGPQTRTALNEFVR